MSQSKDTITEKSIDDTEFLDIDHIDDEHEKNKKHEFDHEHDMDEKHDPRHDIVLVHDDDDYEESEEDIEHESSKKSNFIRNGRDSFDGYKDYYLHGSDIDAFRYPHQHQHQPISIIDIHGNDRNLDQYDDYAEDQYLNGDGDFQDSHETVGQIDDIEIDRDARIIENEERLRSIYDAEDKYDETDSNEADIDEEEKLEQNTKEDKQSQKKDEELNEVIIPDNVAQVNNTIDIDESEITVKKNETNPNLIVTQWVSDKKCFMQV